MNFQVTSKAVYTTTRYLVVDEKGAEYDITCSEDIMDNIFDYWNITSNGIGEIDPDSELGSELIRLCMYQENEKQD